MSALLKVLGVWGVIDSLWLALSPASWTRFWASWFTRIGEGDATPRMFALFELLVSLAMLRQVQRGRLAR